MLITVDEASERPVYAQIADDVRRQIGASRVLPGAVLPPAKELAAGLGINAHTVLHAYQLLRDEGLVDLRRGRGAVVTQAAAGLAAVHTDALALVRKAHDLGVTPATLGAMIAGISAAPTSVPPSTPVSDAEGRER